AGESFNRHTDAIAVMLDLNDLLQDHYHLTFDPAPDSSHLISATLFAAPALTEAFGQLRAKGAGLLAAKQAEMNDRIAFSALLEKAEANINKLQDSLNKATAANAQAKQRLSQEGEQAINAAKAAKALALAEIVNKDQLSFGSADFFNQYTAAIDLQFKLIDTSMQVLEHQLNARVDRLYKNSALLGGAVLLLSLIATIVGIRIARGLLRQMGGEPEYAHEIVNQIASGDLTGMIRLKAGDTSSLLYAMQQMQHSLISIVSKVRAGTNTIAAASMEIAAGNQDLSSRTEQQASSLEETASTIEELTSNVRQNGDNANQANQLAISASDIAVKGGAVVSEVVDMMSEINESSRKMTDIINVIDGIAFQTNILALNAAVEAARAGEQGRGFAVVATEVRSLAQRSASAAREIKSLIDYSVSRVDEGSRLVDQAGETMTQIVSSIRDVTNTMAGINAATREQVQGIEQVNQAMTQMDEVTQQNAALVEQATAAAESLQDQATSLVQLVSIFNTGESSSDTLLFAQGKAPLISRRVVSKPMRYSLDKEEMEVF
ncbi:MAG: methyl-accepting chemotaxis protein, partial [Oxalobacter sp.]|nr:methyl-accepting chemotaxis protein [Oxalobacter sp.]